jgi:serine phosphatase RsbU (regulator of sigma subunit)
VAERYRTIPLRAPTPITDCITARRLVEVHGDADADGRYEVVVGDMWRSGFSSLVAVPVVRGDGAPLGAIGVGWARPTPLDEPTRARIETAVQACGAALDRARRGDQQRGVLDRIQRELLPVVAAPEDLAVAVRYLPATRAIGFGGDWYDLISLGDGRHVAVIGDVVGHGLAAAARMTQVRGALAALIDAEADLPSIVERATGVLQRMTGERNFVATAALALVDPGAGTVDVVCAGHLPPMLRLPGGEVRCLDGSRTPPLGLTAARVEAQRVQLPPGATLFAYTDGLVERRGESITDGLERLSLALGATGFDDTERGVDAVVDAVIEPGDRRDDVAVIALHHTG